MYSQELTSRDVAFASVIEPLLITAGVDIAFWAHDHVYMRSCPMRNGTCVGRGSVSEPDKSSVVRGGQAPVHVVCGTAGAFRDATPNATAPWVVVTDACEGCHRWGYCRFRANSTELHMEYVGHIGVDNATGPQSIGDRLTLVRQGAAASSL